MVDVENIAPALPANSTEGSLKNKDGQLLFTRQWKADDKDPK